VTIQIHTSLFFALILLLGCPTGDDDTSGDDDTGDDDTGDDDTGDDDSAGDDDTAWTPGGCGAPAYTWLPADGMGEIVDWEDGGTFTTMEIAYAEVLGEYSLGAPPVYDVHVYKVRYMTQDRGVALEATAQFVFPVLAEETAVPSLLYHHGTTGFTDACAPSAAGTEYAENVVAASHAARGFAVASPDYLGMTIGAPSEILHPYDIAEPTAVASLDALRALHRFQAGEGDPGLLAVPEARTVLLGMSQGGGAVLYSERYAPHYAPEFDIVAAAAMAPNSEMLWYSESVFVEPSHKLGAGVPFYAAAHRWYGEQGGLDEVLTDACAPSAAGTEYAENVVAASHAARGFAVASPDYLGMTIDHAFFPGPADKRHAGVLHGLGGRRRALPRRAAGRVRGPLRPGVPDELPGV